jgi:hypothetical protein
MESCFAFVWACTRFLPMHASAQGTDPVVTLPRVPELDRPCIDLRLTGARNVPVTARAWLGRAACCSGLGWGGVWVSSPLAPTTTPTTAMGKKAVMPKGVREPKTSGQTCRGPRLRCNFR